MSKKYFFVVLTVLWSFASTSAFAGAFDARRDEVFSTLESLKLEARWNDLIKRKLTDYFERRERAMFDALRIIQDPSTSNREQAAKWREHFSKVGPEQVKLIYSALQDAMPAPALNFVTANANIEADFYAKLGAMPAGQLRDRIMVYRESFDKASKSLSDKWREVNSNDESIDSSARAAQNELRELYNTASRDIASGHISIEKWALWLMEMASQIPGTPELAGPVIEQLKLLEAMETRTEAIAAKLRDLYSNEERVVMVFNNTRRDVAEFLKGMNFTLLTNEINEGLVAIQQTGRNTLTSGQKADAARYAALIGEVVKAHYDVFGKDFETFVRDFDHIFFNSLGDKTIESLLEPQSWRDWSENVRAIALESALKRYQERAEKNFSVDPSLIKDPMQRDLVMKWLKVNMDALKDKIGKVHGSSVSDRVRIVIYMATPGSLRSKLFDRIKETDR